MPAPFGPDSPFYDWAESTPEGKRASYFARQGQFGQSPNRKKFFQEQFQNVMDRYSGEGLKYLSEGGQNPQSWNARLDEYFVPGGESQQDWMAQSPRSRGQQPGRFAPTARYMFGGPQFG